MTGATVDEDVAFYRDIERAFVERRGDPLFISNADWVYLAKLRKKGIPMRVVLRGITDAFDSHQHSFARAQKVRSLKFCEGEIDAAVDRYRRALHADGPGARGVKPALETLAQRVSEPRLQEPIQSTAARIAAAIRDLAGRARGASNEEIDAALAGFEVSLFTEAAAAVGAEACAAIERSARETTAGYQGRMPARVYEDLIAETVRRRVLQSIGLPRLLLSEAE